MKKLLQLSLFLSLSISLFGQQQLLGIVEDIQNDKLIGVKVKLFKNNVLQKDTITNLEGAFVFENVKEGVYTLKLTYTGYRDKMEAVTLTSGKQEPITINMVEDLPFTLGSSPLRGDVNWELQHQGANQIQKGNNLRGTVTEKGGEPIIFGDVELFKANKKIISITTDFDGFFEFKNLESGQYQLKVTYIGFEDLIQTITVEAGTDNEVLLRMKTKPKSENEMDIGYGYGVSPKCCRLVALESDENMASQKTSTNIRPLPTRNINELAEKLAAKKQ